MLHASSSDQTQRIREFVVMGYQGIQNELSTQRGPYLKTLEELLGAPSGDIPTMEGKLRELARTYPNIMDFADQITALQSGPRVSMSAPQVSSATVSMPPLPTSAHLYTGDRLGAGLNHLGRGMPVTVYLLNGEKVQGRVVDYEDKRLHLRTPETKSYRRDEIRAVESPAL